MKLLSFAVGGRKLFGAANGNGVVTLNDKVGEPDLRSALAAGKLQAMRQIAKDAKPDHQLDDIVFLPLIPQPEKILCAGINYRSHAAETGRELPKQPSMFVRFADTLEQTPPPSALELKTLRDLQERTRIAHGEAA